MHGKLNFWLNLALSLLLVAVVLSLFVLDRNTFAQPQILVHVVSGTLLLLGSAGHIALHQGWITAFVIHPSARIAKQVRSKRIVDVGLLVLAVLCGVTGLVAWVSQGSILSTSILSLRAWTGLHKLTGTAMVLVLLVHLVQHRKWFTYAVRRLANTGNGLPAPTTGYAAARSSSAGCKVAPTLPKSQVKSVHANS
jgi:hypothetical protein